MKQGIPQTTVLDNNEDFTLQNGIVGSLYYVNGVATMTTSAFNYGQEHGEI